MAHDGKHFLLNEAQINSLAVVLRLLEERILSLKQLLNDRHLNGVLLFHKNDMSSEQIERLDRSFNRILQTIRQAKDKFGLEEKTTTFSSHLQAFTGYFWSVLTDEKAEKLARYGHVAPELKDELNPLIDQIMGQLQLIDRCPK